MIYLQKSKRKNKKIILAVVFIVLFLFIASILMVKAPTPLGGGVRMLGMPFWNVKMFLGEKTHFISYFFLSKNSIISENDRLKGELELLREKLISFESLKSEHSTLLEEYSRTSSSTQILATVLVRPPQSPYDIIILDVGSRDGIALGDIVYGTGGVALGKITELTGKTSKAVLFSRADIKTEATVQRTGFAITLLGAGGGSFEVEVPQETDILKNDYIIMPSLETIIVGQVVDIEASVTSAFKKLLVKTPINISYTRFVFVRPQN